MKNNKIKPQIFKTDDFHVESKHEKKMYLLNKSELVFNQIANAIELSEKRKQRSIEQRESRIAKRKYYYEFYLFDDDYDYKRVRKEKLPEDFKLRNGEYYLNDDLSGIYKGSEITLIEFLDSIYKS